MLPTSFSGPIVPTAIPRRAIWMAVGFVGAAGAMALRHYLDTKRQPPERKPDEGTPAAPRAQSPSVAQTPPAASATTDAPNGSTEAQEGGACARLRDFLSGDSWFDEQGWIQIWSREGVDDPTSWVKTDGQDTLRAARAKLQEQPALLAGCRRRWIVVCRYAGVDAGEAASLWNETDGDTSEASS